MNKIRELYKYRQMILSSIKKDLNVTYRRSLLGTLWIFINPLLQLWVYNIVFSDILEIATENYYIFLASALIPWIFFSTSIVGGSRCVIDAQDMVKKIYFPREVMPISYVSTAFITMALSFLAVFIVLVFTKAQSNLLALTVLPVVMLTEYMLALGITFIMSALTVYFRDMEFILGIVVMAWQFLTPVMYPREWVPEALQPVLDLNPMTPIVDAYREIIYYQKIPSIMMIFKALGVGIIAFVIGFIIYGKMQKGFAEEL